MALLDSSLPLMVPVALYVKTSPPPLNVNFLIDLEVKRFMPIELFSPTFKNEVSETSLSWGSSAIPSSPAVTRVATDSMRLVD